LKYANNGGVLLHIVYNLKANLTLAIPVFYWFY